MSKTNFEIGEKDEFIEKIEETFLVPERVADKIKHVVEKVKGGYVLSTMSPRWDSKSEWLKMEVAKIVFHKPSGNWIIYWMRASGKWEFYAQYKNFNTVLKVIKEDKNNCFWG